MATTDVRSVFGRIRCYGKTNIESLRELEEDCKALRMGLMIENLPGDFNDAHQLGELLEAMPELGLHLDIGHADLHMPLGTGTVDLAW